MGPNILLDQAFYSTHVELFAELLRSVTWDESMKARKTASYGKPYDYSQMSYPATELPSCLTSVRELLSSRLKIPFNNCLINFYESGRNTMGFHSDDTKPLVTGTGIAILSLGSERTITFRSTDEQTVVDFSLRPGSLLYMGQEVQNDWMHAIQKHDHAGPRMSLTWRAIC